MQGASLVDRVVRFAHSRGTWILFRFRKSWSVRYQPPRLWEGTREAFAFCSSAFREEPCDVPIIARTWTRANLLVTQLRLMVTEKRKWIDMHACTMWSVQCGTVVSPCPCIIDRCMHVRTTTAVAAAKTGAFLMSLGRAEAEDGLGVPRLATMLNPAKQVDIRL